MYFILPRKSSAVDSLIAKLNPSAFSRQMWLMQDLSIAVAIPKFKFYFTSHLESTLREVKCFYKILYPYFTSIFYFKFLQNII